MRRQIIALLLILTAGLIAGCADGARQGQLYQVSVICALQEGAYDWQVSCEELVRHGDLGLGTFEALDGEMVVIDGKVYQVPASGAVRPAAAATKVPFANVAFFAPDRTLPHAAADSFDALRKFLDAQTPSKNLFYAVRIDGTFRYVKTRSVPRHESPYPRLAEAVKRQTTFEFHNVKGTVLGFYCPQYVGGINVPGWHLHFITADRTGGGHLLDVAGADLTVRFQTLRGVQIVLPNGRARRLDQASGKFFTAELGKDVSKELDKIEK